MDDYSSMLELKLIHVGKGDPRSTKNVQHRGCQPRLAYQTRYASDKDILFDWEDVSFMGFTVNIGIW